MSTNEMTIVFGTGAGLALVAGFLLSNSLKKPSPRCQGGLFGLAAGLIGGIVIFELLPSTLGIGSIQTVALGSLAGILCMFLVDHFYHMPLIRHPENDELLTKTGIMVAIGVTIHNLVESFSFGLGYTAGIDLMIMLAVGIGLHNLPLGLAIGVMLKGETPVKSLIIVGVPALAGIAGMLIGLKTARFEITLLASAMSFALGSVAYISITELLPQAILHDKLSGWITFFAGMGVIKLIS